MTVYTYSVAAITASKQPDAACNGGV